jgi:uncharacterized repeat protein (TIGR03803 family)
LRPSPLRTTSQQIHQAERFNETILYSFPLSTKTKSPIFPSSSLSARGDDLYGATAATAGFGGGAGTIFELKNGMTLKIAARFRVKTGGAYPSGVVDDNSGSLFGTTRQGGDRDCLPILGCGTVFELTPSGSSYVRRVLYSFEGGTDGIEPVGGLTIGARGELYGTTYAGGGSGCGAFGCGTVFQLTQAGGNYRERILHRFEGGRDGSAPVGGVASDSSGNLFGVTMAGGKRCSASMSGCGTVYELAKRGTAYHEVVLYRFGGAEERDGAFPISVLAPSKHGTIYGTTNGGGEGRCGRGCGTIFMLVRSRSVYRERILNYFEPAPGKAAREPSRLVSTDAELYGTTELGGRHTSYLFPHGCGTAFALALATGRTTIIHDFSGSPDGCTPTQGVTVGPDGSLYGATSGGGTGKCLSSTGCGTIYELTS